MEDCDPAATGAAATCGGIVVDAYVTLYGTPDECCKQKLGWIQSTKCIADSTKSGSLTGSGKWYVDWKQELCVQDCDNGVAPCGGLANAWDETYVTSRECCLQRLPWVDRDKCTP